jgi:hypothetical protein
MAMLAVAVLGVSACGSSSNAAQTTTNGSQAGGGRRAGFFQSPTVRACLQKQGVTLPNRRPGAGRSFGNGRRPPRRPPQGQRNSARFQKLRAALQKCGVQFRAPGQAPNGGTGGSNS